MTYDDFILEIEKIIGYKPTSNKGLSNIARPMEHAVFLGGPNLQNVDGSKPYSFCSKISASPYEHLYFCLNFGKKSKSLSNQISILGKGINNSKIVIDNLGIFISTRSVSDNGAIIFDSQKDIRVEAETFYYYVDGYNKSLFDTIKWISSYFKGEVESIGDSLQIENKINEPKIHELNQILYGPPGTGKTHNVINHALAIIRNVKIIDIINEQENDKSGIVRKKDKSEFDDLLKEGRIQFVTFHQSYSYEEFVEGLKAKINERDDVYYEIEDGVFKKMCLAASKNTLLTINLSGKEIELTKDLFETLYYEYSSQLPIQSENYSNFKLKTKEGYDFHLFKNSNESIVVKAGTWKNPMSVSCNELINILFENKQPTYKSYSEIIIDNIFDGKGFKKTNISNINKPYVLIIDEINRGNISKIFGELITLIESSKRKNKPEELKIKLTYSGSDSVSKLFSIPDNLYIIGTMNTADKSIALVDIALRRRFNFIEYTAKPEMLGETEDGINLEKLLREINKRIEFFLDKDHLIGHAYFLNINSSTELAEMFKNKILPLLQEYFYNDYRKIALVLGNHIDWQEDSKLYLICKNNQINVKGLFGSNLEDEFEGKDDFQFVLNKELMNENYESIGPDFFISMYINQYKP